MTRVGVALALAMVVTFGSAASAGSGDAAIADGFVDGREHEVRLRPVLLEVPKEAAKLKRAARSAGALAVASCDPAQVEALGRKVPTTPRDGDEPAACVVMSTSNDDSSERLLLGPSVLTGSELDRVALRRQRRQRRLEVRLSTRGQALWTFLGTQAGDAPLAFTLDGDVLDRVRVTPDASSLTDELAIAVGPFPEDEAERIQDLLEQSEQEEIIELAREASLSRSARELFAQNDPSIREKTTFVEDCPLPESDDTFALGCYDSFSGEIAVLRVQRADVAGVMPVTAAHEMLHAAYHELDAKTRNKVDAMIEEFLAVAPLPAVEEELAVYSEEERANEVHSLLGTEVRELSPRLERYYGRYFEDRAAVVTLFEAYESVFDALEARYAVLTFELAALEEQLNALDGQVAAAGNEADALSNQIDQLRAQGQFDAANNLVGAQNAAADRANSLANQFNAVVGQYNAKVAELNAAGLSLENLYSDISAV